MSDPDHRGRAAAQTAPDPFARDDAPILQVTLWPYRSLKLKGYAWVIGLFACGLATPLIALAGSSVAWGLLPFLIAALVALDAAIRASYASARLTEELRLWPDLITVERREPKGRILRWHANPFWVRVRLHDDARIEKYLTLTGNDREIELGAFLSPGERETLFRDLRTALHAVRDR